MEKIVYIFLVLITTSCSISKEYKKSIPSDSYPFLGTLIEGYYRVYYEYPETLDEFISDCDLREWKEFNKVIPFVIKKLKKEKKDIIWNLDSEKLIVTKDNDTIYEIINRNPCYHDDEYFDYYNRILLYDKKGRWINSEKLRLKFWKGMKDAMDEVIEPEQKYGDLFLLKYTPETELVPFCDNDSLEVIKYYDTMNSFIENFVKEKHLGKVVFVLRKFL